MGLAVDRAGFAFCTVMVTKVQTLTGYAGYRHQLDRARRFLARVEQMRWFDADSEDISEHDFQDMMWAFFQNCWHVKDWVCNDKHLNGVQKDSVIIMAHQSTELMACRDLCNGTKHLGEKPGARHGHIDTIFNAPGGQPLQRDCIVENASGTEVSGVELGRACIAEWERIFASQNLSTAWQSDSSCKTT
jgi:hypothetical protein